MPLHIGFLIAAFLLDRPTSLGKTGCQAARASEWAGRRCRMEIGGSEDGFAEGALRATEAGEGVELSAASAAMSSLDALQARLDRKLQALGASDVAPPSAATPRSSFSKESSAETRRLADAKLEAMRRKKSGAAEVEHAAEIATAVRDARRWLDAGLPRRAEKELAAVSGYVSLSSESGGEFHLLLADVLEADANNRGAEARRLLQRLADESTSSSVRWKAERRLSRSASSGGGSAAGPSSSELGSLFGQQFGLGDGRQW
mmetsp:Transcript_7784/g.24904  ORF Transcript_7784/g.24904 Transcript_7784/m.24904 type:complete len:260 (-) Transcript_7784:26-805(-)